MNKMPKLMFLTNSDRPTLSTKPYERLRKYCDRWGHGLKIYDHNVDPSRHISWSKIPILFKAFEESPEYDYYVWIDDDILITNPDIDFAQFLEGAPSTADIIASADIAPQWPFNAGFLVVKKQAADLFQLAWSLVDMLNARFTPNWEQDAMIFLYFNHEPFHRRIHIIPHKRMQSFYRDYNVPPELHWTPGDFAAHITGMPMERRLAVLEKLVSIEAQEL